MVPIVRQYEWAVGKNLAHAIVTPLSHVLPALFVDKSAPENHVDRIFVDFLRNGRGAATVSAWSARVGLGAGISIYVAWKDIRALKAAGQLDCKEHSFPFGHRESAVGRVSDGFKYVATRDATFGFSA